MRSAVSLAIVFVLLVALSACSSPEEPPIRAATAATKAVGSQEAREAVDQFVGALSSGDLASLDGLLCGRALEASRTLVGISDARLISVTEDPSAESPKSEARAFEVQCDVTYSQRADMDQSGVYVYRLRVMRTPDGVKIENIGP